MRLRSESRVPAASDEWRGLGGTARKRPGITFVILVKQLFILGGLSVVTTLRSGKVMTLGNLLGPCPVLTGPSPSPAVSPESLGQLLRAGGDLSIQRVCP